MQNRSILIFERVGISGTVGGAGDFLMSADKKQKNKMYFCFFNFHEEKTDIKLDRFCGVQPFFNRTGGISIMSSMNVSSYSTLSSRTGVMGLASGLDNTEELIEQLTTGTTNKITAQLQERQQALWKQSFYQEITTKMTDFYNEYFSYSTSSSNNILKSDFFDTSTITSSSSYVTVTGDTAAATDMKVKDIKQLATQANFTSTHAVSNQSMMTGTLSDTYQYNTIARSTVTFTIGGTAYTATVDSDFYFSEDALATDEDGNFTDDALELQTSELKTALEDAISSNDDLAGKISVSFSDDNKLTFASTDGSTFKITGGTSKFLSAIGITASTSGTASSSVTGSSALDVSSVAYLKDIEECLSGTTLTVTLNGISETLEFKESEKEQYDTIEELASYFQTALDDAFGEDSVYVTLTDDNKLSFATTQEDEDGSVTGNSSAIFTIGSSSASSIVGTRGALHVAAGESNRIEYSKTLDELSGSFSTALTADEDGNYSLTVNGKTFSYSGDTLLGDVITGITADEDAGVTISYSSVTDTFSVKADKTGANGKVVIADSGTSNLASVLFGVSGTDYTVTDGTNFVASMSFDGGNTYVDVTRSSNSFTIDDVTLSFSAKADGDAEENISFTADDNVDDLYDKLSGFIDDYNEIMDWLNTKINETLYGRTSSDDTDEYLPLTDEQKEDMSDDEIEAWEEKAKTGLLRNDSSLYQITLNLRESMNDLVGDTGLGLYQIGISTSSDYSEGGKLVVDEDTLKEALTTNLDTVKKIFTTQDTGVAYRLQTVLKEAAVGTSDADGLLVQIAGKSGSSTESTMSKQISYMSDRLDDLKDQLETEEDYWWDKFTTLETYISNMNSQSSWLSSYTSSSSSSS